MVMGFALCASVAFAQTNRISREDARKYEKAPTEAVKAPVDYKASIFGKANGHDTIQCFEIDNASDYTIGVIAATDVIDDTTVTNANRHTVSGDKNRWMRSPSVQDFTANFTSFVPGLSQWLSFDSDGDDNAEPHPEYITEDIDPSVSPREPNDNGFMFLSYMETRDDAGCFNTYFTLPTVTRPASAKMIEVSLTQCYRKYYDKCYIDYQANGNWYSREINIDGIDMGVNNWGANKVRYVMPHGLNGQNNINLRIRAWSNHRGSAWGYFWAVDNVAVMALTLSEYWALNSPTNIDGFYGMIPAGMTIPMTYGVNAQNLSINDINAAHATVNAGTDRNSLTQAFVGPNVTVPMNTDLNANVPVIINERGFFVEGEDAASGYQSWPNEGTHTNYGNAGLPDGFSGHGLPVANTGKNFYNINVAGGNLSRTYDTVLYYVTDYETFTESSRENGYRWAHDNGIIPSAASFQVAFTDNDPNGNHYVTDQGSSLENGGHVGMAGYAVHNRFITGNTIPTDDQGNPWVFRGIELIAATDRDVDNMEGAYIVPIAYQDVYENDGLSFSSLPCGIDGLSFEVSEDDINVGLIENNLGYITPDQGYKAINIQFVEQPVLEPNTSYRFGYRLAGDADFALAGTRNTFRYTASNDTTYTVSFGYNGDRTELAQKTLASRDYRYVPTPATFLEVMAFDPLYSEYITAWNIDNYPMIRPIVGPARPVEYAHIGALCDDNTDTNAVKVSRSDGVDFCGQMIDVVAGSSVRVDFDPVGEHTVLDSVLVSVNGSAPRALTRYDDGTGEGDYMVGDATVYTNPDNPTPDSVLLSREFWYIFLQPAVDDEYEFTVFSHWEEWDNVGIDPVAPEVRLGLAPNPATSSVKLNIQGVTGMVNCSILDMSGRVIYNANINAETEHMVNVSNLPAGAYFVRVTNDTFSKIEKLIIK